MRVRVRVTLEGKGLGFRVRVRVRVKVRVRVGVKVRVRESCCRLVGVCILSVDLSAVLIGDPTSKACSLSSAPPFFGSKTKQ